jgi:hypothetical protein
MCVFYYSLKVLYLERLKADKEEEEGIGHKASLVFRRR